MKIVMEPLAASDLQSLDDIADRYGLTLYVTERSKANAIGGWSESSRWSAGFRSLEIMDHGMLVGVCGRGATPEAAIEDYARRLKGQRVAVHAMCADRKEFRIPEDLVGRREKP